MMLSTVERRVVGKQGTNGPSVRLNAGQMEGSAPTVQSSDRRAKRDRIFAVDDVSDNLFLLQAILDTDESYEVITFSDGPSVLQAIQENPPALLLLDVMMPDMDGYEVTRRIRNNPALPYIPILLITAHNASNVVVGLDSGADDFLRKPYSMDELSARVRSLLRLKHSIDAQTQLTSQREDLVTRLTHDLRTPLVAANRVLEMAVAQRLGPTSDELKTMLASVLVNNQQLLHMVNTLLEVYRHDAGRKDMAFARVNLHQLAEEVVQQLMPLAAQSQLSLTLVELPPDSQQQYEIQGDPMELRRVLTNLVGNAIKFTDRGSITLKCHLDRGEGDRPIVRLTVQDTGAGISPVDQKMIFERFRQGEHLRSGSGLGLHLARYIVEAHGGTIGVESGLGQGSTFAIAFPSYKPLGELDSTNEIPS